MKLRQRGLVASILMATLVVSPLVDAKRAGNGKSQGMQRSIAPSQSSQQQRVRPQPSPSYNNTAPQPQQQQGSGIGKMVAAGAAGAAVGALATHALADNNHAAPANNGNASNTGTANANDATQNNNQQQHAEQPAEKKSGGLPWLWIILIAGAGFFIFRKMSAKKKLESNNNPYSPNNNGGSSFGSNSTAANTSNDNNTNIFGQNVGGGTNMNTEAPFTSNGNQLPDGTEQAAFLRIARQRFNHIQSINSAKNIEEIRRYLTNDLYNSMYQDVMANQEQDVAEFENLTATLADTATENGQYIASVRFTGMVSEDLNSSPKPFSEIWHFVKPVNSQQDWLVAGIQVES